MKRLNENFEVVEFIPEADLSTTGKVLYFKVENTTIAYSIWDQDNSVLLQSIRTPNRFRGQGSARRALTEFLKQTDLQKLPVDLGASPLDHRTKISRLIAFYTEMGFQLTGKTINALGHPEMRRTVSAPPIDTKINQKPKNKSIGTKGIDFK